MKRVRWEKENILNPITNKNTEKCKCITITENVDNPYIIHYVSLPKPFMIDGIYNDKYSKLYKFYLDKIKEKLKEINIE